MMNVCVCVRVDDYELTNNVYENEESYPSYVKKNWSYFIMSCCMCERSLTGEMFDFRTNGISYKGFLTYGEITFFK